jgi:hypothetical protein
MDVGVDDSRAEHGLAPVGDLGMIWPVDRPWRIEYLFDFFAAEAQFAWSPGSVWLAQPTQDNFGGSLCGA